MYFPLVLFTDILVENKEGGGGVTLNEISYVTGYFKKGDDFVYELFFLLIIFQVMRNFLERS